jgi:tripartite-type tricarboxylate transporter receptor subunit TctC
MIRIANRALARFCLLGVSLLAGGAAHAQEWPTRPVRMIVAYPPGGVSDIISRALAERLAASLGVPVVVENKAGAGGSLGMDAVAKAAPDGYTVGFSSISPLSLNPLVGRVPYDPFKDIAPVAGVMISPVVLLGTPAFKGATLADVLSQARARPGALRWATSGPATVGHLTLEQFKLAAGVDITHVPYKGGGQQQTDALGGQFELLTTNLGPALNAQIKAGRLRPLAVGSPRRLDFMPDVQTFAEAGFPKANMMSVFGVFAPAGTPPDVVRRLNAGIDAALAQPALRARLVDSDNVPTGGSPEDFARAIRSEYDNNREIITRLGKLD